MLTSQMPHGKIEQPQSFLPWSVIQLLYSQFTNAKKTAGENESE